MKPIDIFKKRKVRNKEMEEIWDRIKHQHCVVLTYNNKNMHTIIKDGKDNYLWISKNLGHDDIWIMKHAKTMEFVNNMCKIPIEYKDDKLFDEWIEYLVMEAI